VPATKAARRDGHGFAVLLMINAHCIDGQAEAANKRITDAFDTADTEFGPATREMMTVRRRPQIPGQRKKAGRDGLHNRSHPSCKTVGSAYVSSNPTPATTCENDQLAANSRAGGPFLLCPAVCHLVSL
jgi:hypothetical protein